MNCFLQIGIFPKAPRIAVLILLLKNEQSGSSNNYQNNYKSILNLLIMKTALIRGLINVYVSSDYRVSFLNRVPVTGHPVTGSDTAFDTADHNILPTKLGNDWESMAVHLSGLNLIHKP